MSVWDREAADWYAGRYGDDPSIFAVLDAVEAPSGAAVLDIGCGTGSALRALIGKAGALTGVDPTERMIEIARDQTPGGAVVFHVAAAEALPVGDCSQDMVLAINAVHHWADEARGFAEAVRVLKPGGMLVIGGESFGRKMAPAGQDYGARLRALGLVRIRRRTLPEGFVQTACKPAGGQ